MNADELRSILFEVATGDGNWTAQVTAQINNWLVRGDGVAIYQNQDMNHPELGHRQIASYGSPAAQLETDEPPKTLPDIGGAINWRYQLEGTYRGEQL